MSHVFSVSDFRHAVIDSATLLCGRYLSQCPVTTVQDVVSGLFLSALATDVTREAQKHVPEVLPFVRTVLSLYVSTGNARQVTVSDSRGGSHVEVGVGKEGATAEGSQASSLGKKSKGVDTNIDASLATADVGTAASPFFAPSIIGSDKAMTLLKTVTRESFQTLRLAASKSFSRLSSRTISGEVHSTFESIKIPWRCFQATHKKSQGRVNRVGDEDTRGVYDHTVEGEETEDVVSYHAVAILCTCYRVLESLHTKYKDNSGYCEVFSQVIDMLRIVRPHDEPKLPPIILSKHIEITELLTKHYHAVKSTRKPLLWRNQSNSIEKKMLVTLEPRYELNYAIKKDKETDALRVQSKQLTRQLKREKKAAMRELRRDTDFLEQERYKEQRAVKEKKVEERAKNFAWLEEQHATMNQHVKQGHGLLKGGGNGALKKRFKRTKR